MAFITNAESNRRRKRPSNKHMEWAGRLKEAFADAKMLDKLPSTTRWAEEFRLLNDLQPEAEIEKALKWVVKNVMKFRRREKGVPPIRSASGFRNNFHWILDLVHKEGLSESSPEADRLIQRVLSSGWHPDVKADLPKVITASYNRYKIFISRLRAHYQSIEYALHKKKRQGEFRGSEVELVGKTNAVLTEMSFDFLPKWFIGLVKPRMSEKFTNIDYFEWHPHHPDFRRLALRWTNGDLKFWNRLLSTLEE